jgi:hypothetical protein
MVGSRRLLHKIVTEISCGSARRLAERFKRWQESVTACRIGPEYVDMRYGIGWSAVGGEPSLAITIAYSRSSTGASKEGSHSARSALTCGCARCSMRGLLVLPNLHNDELILGSEVLENVVACST